MPGPTFRVVVTPAMGNPAFLVQCRVAPLQVFTPFDGAVMERPDRFKPYETLSKAAAQSFARMCDNGVSQAHIIEWRR